MYSRLWALENLALGSVSLSLNLSMLYAPEYALQGTGEVLVTVVILVINLGTLLMFAWVMVFDAGKEQILDMIDLDGDGDLTWEEITHVARVKAYQSLAPMARKVGMKLKNPEISSSSEDEYDFRKATTLDQARRFADIRQQRKIDETRRLADLLGSEELEKKSSGRRFSNMKQVKRPSRVLSDAPVLEMTFTDGSSPQGGESPYQHDEKKGFELRRIELGLDDDSE